MSKEDIPIDDLEIVDPSETNLDDQEILEEIEMSNNSIAYFEHEDSVYLVASHPELPIVVTGGGDNKAHIWSTIHSPPQIIASFEFSESVVAGGFCAGGKTLVLGDMNGELKVYTLTDDRWVLASEQKEVDEIVSIQFHNSKDIFAVCGKNGQDEDAEGSVWVYEFTTSLENLSVISMHSAVVNTALFVPAADSDRLLTLDEEGRVVLTDIYTSATVFNIELYHPWVTATLSPSKKSAALGAADGSLYVIRLDDGTVLNKVEVCPTALEEDRGIEGLSWCDKQGFVITGNVGGTISILDIKTWKPRRTIQLEDSITKLQFVKNSTIFTASAMDSSLKQFDALNGELIYDCLGHNEGVLGFATQDGGAKIISASDDCVSLVYLK